MERHARFFTLWHASTVKCVLFLGGWIGDPFWPPVPPENQMLPKKCSSLQLYKHKLPINRPWRPICYLSMYTYIYIYWLRPGRPNLMFCCCGFSRFWFSCFVVLSGLQYWVRSVFGCFRMVLGWSWTLLSALDLGILVSGVLWPALVS